MKLTLKLDAGDVYSVATLKIEKNDTSATLFAKLADLGAMTLLIALPKIFDGSLKQFLRMKTQLHMQ